MPNKKTPHSHTVRDQIDKELLKEVKMLSKEVRKLKDLEFVRILKHPMKFMWFSFLKGLMVGFGSVLGASVLVAVFVYLIAQISFVPIVGSFVEDLFKELNVEQVLTEKSQGNDALINQYQDTKDGLEKTQN